MSDSKQHIAQTLLARAHSPDTAATQFTERIKQKPLFLRPTSPSAQDNRDRRRLHRLRKKEYFLKHQRPRPMTARVKRETGLYDLPKEECKYDLFKGLHALWVGYMQEILDLKSGGRSGVVTPVGHGAKLVSADYHGAEVEVVRSGCASRVGLKGIVARDTRFTFQVVTEKDELKSEFLIPIQIELGVELTCEEIPKEHTVFRFTVPLPEAKGDEKGVQQKVDPAPLVFELHGSQFETRPVDRANKKFKWRNVDYV